jgi:hypothetical protein
MKLTKLFDFSIFIIPVEGYLKCGLLKLQCCLPCFSKCALFDLVKSAGIRLVEREKFYDGHMLQLAFFFFFSIHHNFLLPYLICLH